MEELDKTQLILLALLVSFVTSIATGIVTVTLLDQAPPGVTQTINRIVERTVEVIVPDETKPTTITQIVVVKEEDFVVEAAEKNSGNIVSIGHLKRRGFTLGTIGRDIDEEQIFESVGIGFIVSPEGLVVTPYAPRQESGALVAQTINGDLFEATVLLRDEERGLVLVQTGKVIRDSKEKLPEEDEERKVGHFNSIVFADSNTTRIGQTAIALGTDQGLLLLLGVVSRMETSRVERDNEIKKEVVTIYTTIDMDDKYSGGPLLNTNGKVVGINVVRGADRFTIPVNIVQELLDEYRDGENSTINPI